MIAGALATLSLSSLEGVPALEVAPAHLVGAGGAIGAVCRHWVSETLGERTFPAATLAVNVVGSFVLALAVFLGVGDAAMALVGVGACGSFTTFSSFSVETVGLWERGRRRLAIVNAGSNLALSLAGVGLAWLLASLG